MTYDICSDSAPLGSSIRALVSLNAGQQHSVLGVLLASIVRIVTIVIVVGIVIVIVTSHRNTNSNNNTSSRSRDMNRYRNCNAHSKDELSGLLNSNWPVIALTGSRAR